MMDKPDIERARLHSLPRYRQPAPQEAVCQPLVVIQSADSCPAFVGTLDQPTVLNAENGDFNDRLGRCLATCTVGTRLYLVGDEAFIWRIHALARSAGLQDDEIDMTLSVPGVRTVYCVHCGQRQPGTQQDSLQCSGCRVLLEIREHFSRRLGAYLGVCGNPDQPYAGFRP
ncbi:MULTISPECIES: dimethylamine monooxygenase subunit DmmA family protein [unclassified Pseudomonas]|uniref:dimethylamine monooxygenase subunit DmmA family protein n=1 Tax=unclassified Pseudomonas TaxID=196821 RepID=UPI00384FBB34